MVDKIDAITEKIIGSAYLVSNTLGSGFLEKVYQNALFHEILTTDLIVFKQYPVNVWYKGALVGEYFADLMVEENVVVEIKA